MYEVEIKRMDHEGRGIGYIENIVTFIPNALPGEIVLCEIVETKKKYKTAKVVEYKKKALNRTNPFCPYYLKCGGCHLQHLSYEDTLKYKKCKIENILEKEKIEVIKNQKQLHYRNKLSLKIKEGQTGFYKENSHELIEIETCGLASESINNCIPKLKYLKIKNGKVTIRANYNDEVLLILETEDKISFNEEDFKDIKVVGVILNGNTIYGKNFFFERMNGFLFKVSFDSFFQTNPYITSKLFTLLEENVKNANTVLELYSGVGTLGLIASKKAKKVYSIEIIKNAVLNNVENSKLNKQNNIYPILGDAKSIFSKIKEEFDTIIIDPPRKGIDKDTLELILKSNAKQVFYISCNPMTLKRDLLELEKKYEIRKIYVLDMFSYTYHVECAVLLYLKETLQNNIK